jgi:Tfp pilus assembly protein PilO
MKLDAKKFFFGLMTTLGILVVGGAAGYVLASNMLATKTEALQKRMAAEAVAEDRLVRLADLKKQYERITPLLARFDTALPKNKKQSEITLQLQQLASANGMGLPAVTFSASESPSATSQTIKSGSILALPITFQLSGTYEQMQGFLRGLEQLDRYTTVTSLSIAKGDTKTRSVTFSVGINVYIKP